MSDIYFSSYSKCDMCDEPGIYSKLIADWPHEGIEDLKELCYDCTKIIEAEIERLAGVNGVRA